MVLDEYEILLNKAISFLKTTEEENDDNPTEIARLFEYLRKKCEADELSSTSEKTITVDTTTSMGP